MHPLILQQLAADRVSYMIAKAERRHQAHHARVARRSQLPRGRADIERFSADTEILTSQAGPLRSSADGGRASEVVGAERTSRQA
jgi:hypothetical protein